MKHFFYAGSDAMRRPCEQARHESDVFRDGKVWKQTRLLNDVADGAAEGDFAPLCRGAACDDDLTSRREEQAVDQSQEGRLPASGAAKEDDSLTGEDLE